LSAQVLDYRFGALYRELLVVFGCPGAVGVTLCRRLQAWMRDHDARLTGKLLLVPCGNGERRFADLRLGPARAVRLAGIGHFYLRMADPVRIPTVLLPGC
jgi:hypothetical protein